MRRDLLAAGAALLAWLVPAATGRAEEPEPTPQSTTAPAPTAAAPEEPGYDEDLDLDRAEPDFEVVTLPTNLRLPRHKMGFRLTHRFTRDLGEGDFSDLLADLFGFDDGAQIGLGLRYGLFRGTQVGIYRTNDRTIQLFARQELLREGKAPLGLSVAASVEGLNNFGLSDPRTETLHEFSPSVGLVLSKKLGSRGAVYVVPSWAGNTRINRFAPPDDDGTLVIGLGARVVVTGAIAIVGEYHPRLAGYRGAIGSGGDPDSLATFGLEGRVGGHAFQLNFSNALGTTPAQVARGAQGEHGWFIGFNLTRKFY